MSDSLNEASVRNAQDNSSSSAKRILGRGASTSFVLQVVGLVLQYATNIVFARSMGVGQFGEFTYAVNWARIGGTLSHLGGASSAIRFVPELTAKEDWPHVAGVIRRARQIPLLVGGALAAVSSGAVLAVQGTTRSSAAMALALWLIPVAALIEVQQSLIRSYKQIFRAFFPWLVVQPAIAIGVALAAVVVKPDLGAPAAVGITAGSYIVAAVLQWWWLRAALPASVRHARPAYAMREWARVTGPIFSSNIVFIVFSRLDVVMVGLLVGAKEAGIYAIAMRAGNLVQIGQTAMSATVAPRISQLYWAGREKDLQRLVHTSVRWVFFPTLALFVAMSALAVPILRVFGEPFVAGRWVLIWIAAGQLVSVSSGPVGWVMNLTGREKVAAVVFGATAAVTIIGYLLLIPAFGIVGAAIANSGALAVRNVALTILARRHLGYDVSVWRSLRPGNQPDSS